MFTEEALAEGRARYQHLIRVCGGTCGRDTRSTKVPKHLFPDTVTRTNATHCTSCQRDDKEEALRAAGKEVPPRGHYARKPADPERIAEVAAVVDRFTAARRARLAKQGWFLHHPVSLPPNYRSIGA